MSIPWQTGSLEPGGRARAGEAQHQPAAAREGDQGVLRRGDALREVRSQKPAIVATGWDVANWTAGAALLVTSVAHVAEARLSVESA